MTETEKHEASHTEGQEAAVARGAEVRVAGIQARLEVQRSV